MGIADKYVHKRVRRGQVRYAIDFRYTCDGQTRRYQKDAQIQSASAARKEAEDRILAAKQTGSPLLAHERTATPTKPAKKGTTLGDFVTGKFESVFMPTIRRSTEIRYRGLLRQHILPRYEQVQLADITPNEVRAYYADLSKLKIQPRGPLNLVRTILRVAHEQGTLPELPAWPRKLCRQSKKLPDAPTDEEVAAMLEHATGWLKVAIALAAFAGLRAGEVRGLEVADVGREDITVRRAMSEDAVDKPKSGNDRKVPVIPQLREVLKPAFKNKLPKARVVIMEDGQSPWRQKLLTVFVAMLRRHHLRPRSFHSLRHYFCSTLVRRGASLEAVRELAGHSSLEVTQRYVHAVGADRTAAMAKLATVNER